MKIVTGVNDYIVECEQYENEVDVDVYCDKLRWRIVFFESGAVGIILPQKPYIVDFESLNEFFDWIRLYERKNKMMEDGNG